MPLNIHGEDSLYWAASIDPSGVKTGAREVEGIIGSLTSRITKADIFAAISIGAAYHTKKAIQEFTLLAARYETLGVVMQTVGNNAGYSTSELNDFQRALESTGISMIQSRQNITRMVQANLDLTRSTELARIAQDAAVIGNINSSEAFERMIYGIQSAQVEMLRTIGINVNFENAYQKVAKATGRAATEFSEVEKAQIRMNVVLESGAKIAGTYEAAMDTAGKQMNSLERHSENLKVRIGLIFTPVLLEAVQALTGAYSGLNEELEQSEEKVSDWGNRFRLVFIRVEADIMRLGMLIDKIGGTMTAMLGIFASAFAALKIPGSEGVAEKAAEWNVAYENRYNKTLSDLEALAEKYDEVAFSMTETGKKTAEATRKAKEEETLARQKAIASLEAEEEAVKKVSRSYEEANKYKLMQADRDVEREQRIAQQYGYSGYSAPDGIPEEFRRTQEWQRDFAVEMALITEREIENNKKVSLERMFRDTRNMNERELREYSAFLNAQARLRSDNEAEYKTILEERQRVTSSIYDAEIRKIREIGDVITDFGGLIDRFDGDLGQFSRDVGDVINSFANLQNTTTGWGETAGLLQIAGAVDEWADKLSKYLVKAQETTRGKDPMSLYWDGWDQFVVAQKQFQISITAGDERVRRMEELIAYLETRLDADWKKLDPLDRIRAEQDIENQKKQLAEYRTGTTAESIASSIADGFAKGLDSAEVFASTFEDMMRDALLQAFEQKTISRLFQPFYDQLAELGENGYTAQEIEHLRMAYQSAVLEANSQFEFIKDLAPDLFTGTSTPATGLAGAIQQSITEDTAGVIEGQLLAMRSDAADMLDLADRHLTVSMQIRDNTKSIPEYLPYLKSIDSRMGNLERSLGKV